GFSGKVPLHPIGQAFFVLGGKRNDDPCHGADAGAGGDRAGRRTEADRFIGSRLPGQLGEDPFSGCVFIFRNRSAKSILILAYDGQGYWLAQKRLSQGRFTWWPESSSAAKRVEAYEAQLLMVAGDVSRVCAAPMWRRVSELK